MAYNNKKNKPMSTTAKILLWGSLAVGVIAGIVFIPWTAGKSLYKKWKEKKQANG